MPLSINTNVTSLSTQRRSTSAGTDLARSVERLGSGLRINRAADDAAGLAIADRMNSGLRGMNQARRNISDAASMLQVADGAMAQVSEDLQRLRELAVQAGNGSFSPGDRAALQQEAGQLLQQISKVGEQTAFNGQAIFAQDNTSIGGDARHRAVLDGLKTGWLSSAEALVKQYYGLTADGVTLTVNLDGFTDGPANVLASVSGTVFAGSGQFNNVHLNIDMADFGTSNTADGGGPPLYSDRIIAHEMVHAIMSRTTDFQFPQWFIEGTAELIQGADERLRAAISPAGGLAAVVASVGSGFTYEGAYAASRYMHEKLKELGVAGGMKGVMQYLNQHQAANLDQALNAVTGGAYANTSAFVADFTANGANFITTRMDLANQDTGAIGGLDADGGPSRNARDVVADVGTGSADSPLEGFKVVFPTNGGATGTRRVQVQAGPGVSQGDTIELGFSAMNAAALGLADLDLTRSAVALLHIDEALDFVTQQRVVAGASGKRLDVAADTLAGNSVNLAGARSRIRDADIAAEATALTRSRILQQAASAMLTQANSQPRAVLALLR
jgi:flagellin